MLFKARGPVIMPRRVYYLWHIWH